MKIEIDVMAGSKKSLQEDINFYANNVKVTKFKKGERRENRWQWPIAELKGNRQDLKELLISEFYNLTDCEANDALDIWEQDVEN